MVSQINTLFPVEGQDNESEGFRANFRAASQEINDLQTRVLGTEGNISNIQTTLGTALLIDGSRNMIGPLTFFNIFQNELIQYAPGDWQGSVLYIIDGGINQLGELVFSDGNSWNS